MTVEYDYAPALCCDDEDEGHERIYAWIDYILETGALWAGTIGRLDIVYYFAVPPPGGVMVYDKLVGPLLEGEGPWRLETDEGAPRGWSRRAQRVSAPEGVLDLWNPSVRFHYAFACQANRIVLRLKATDVEPRGNLSLGVQNIESRLELAAGRQNYGEPDFEPCATRGEPEGPEAAWGCSFVHHESFWNNGERDVRVSEYRFDCCCGSAAEKGGWNPSCDAEPRGKGCAAAASSARSSPAAPLVQTVVAPDAGATDAGKGAEADDVLDAAADAGPAAEPEAGASDVAAPTPSPAADGSGLEGGPLTATADVTPPSAPSAASVDASTAPATRPAKKGCGCAVGGADDAAWSGLATLGALLLLRKHRRDECRTRTPRT